MASERQPARAMRSYHQCIKGECSCSEEDQAEEDEHRVKAGSMPDTIGIYTDMIYLACAKRKKEIIGIADAFANVNGLSEETADRVKALLFQAFQFH